MSSTKLRDRRLSPCRLAGPMVALFVAAGCATNPATGNREITFMSEAQEISLGRQYDAEVRQEMGVYDDSKLQLYVEEIGMQLARNSERPNLPWHFTIVNVAAVNAFALPGGYIYLTRGIMPYLDNEAQLAGVLGHEIGHVTARHAAQAYTKATGAGIGLTIASIFFPATRPFGQLAETGFGLLFLKHGRDDELQADRLGAAYTAKGGWDPRGVPDLLRTLARIEEVSDRRGVPNWLSTHPHPADRVEKIESTVQTLVASTDEDQWTRGHDEFLQRIDRLIFGDNPEEGIVRASEFLHPELRFALTFPQGWEITNGKAQVVARLPNEKAFMLLQLVEDPQGRNLEEIAVRGMQRAGFRTVEDGMTTVNGLQAHVGTYRGRVDDIGDVLTRAAHITLGRNVYILAGMAPPSEFDKAASLFGASIRSFRQLSPSEASNLKPNEISLYTVQAGDTWQSIAERACRGTVRASTLAIMNDSAVNQQPESGQRIKIVVPG